MVDNENSSQEDVMKNSKSEERRKGTDRRKNDRRKFAFLSGKDRRDGQDRRSSDRRTE
jgi:hypothetical protein